MSPTRTLPLRTAPTGLQPHARVGIAAVALLLTLTIYVIGFSVDHTDAPLLLLAVPLALASMAYGMRGGIGMGVLASFVAAAWWVAKSQYGGMAWISWRVITCLFIGALLGWFAGSRQSLARAVANHRSLSLDLIATASFDGYFTEVNPAFTRTLGFTSEELLSEPFVNFVHPDDVEPTLAAIVEQTEEGRDVLNFQNRYRTKDGSYRWLEWTSSPDPRGRELIAVARDVTDRKQLEELEREYQHRLENDVRERTKELNRRNADLDAARRETLYRLALAAEYRDDDTFEHTERIRDSVALLAAELGLPESDVELIRDAAPLHDIGKLGVSDAVLLKPGKLTADELEHMRRHAETGARILSGSSSDVLRAGEEIARSHHEWWDGTGYPSRLRGEEIPLSARIVAVADVFDALTHKRPYKPAWPMDEAVAEIHRLRSLQFDPLVVDAFDRLDPYRLAGIPRTDEARPLASKQTRAA
ncbi:MAG TPA: HD domain-containing phosphohydrolase [Gaiellaceae bacterium]|nr:HD domain-containing phosphohydrolase [Gaiellaceae bacterium]